MNQSNTHHQTRMTHRHFCNIDLPVPQNPLQARMSHPYNNQYWKHTLPLLYSSCILCMHLPYTANHCNIHRRWHTRRRQHRTCGIRRLRPDNHNLSLRTSLKGPQCCRCSLLLHIEDHCMDCRREQPEALRQSFETRETTIRRLRPREETSRERTSSSVHERYAPPQRVKSQSSDSSKSPPLPRPTREQKYPAVPREERSCSLSRSSSSTQCLLPSGSVRSQ